MEEPPIDGLVNGSADEPADELAVVRTHLLDPESLVRAVASGRRRGEEPPWRRVELRHVDLKAGRHLQVTAYDATQAHTTNHPLGDGPGGAAEAVDGLLALPFGNWHVETATGTHQLRVTKKGRVLLHSTRREVAVAVDHGHDREKPRLVPADDPLWRALGLAGADGRIKPGRQAKWRQVEEFLRVLDDTVTDALAAGHLRRPTPEEPLRLVDLGCGNGYLTFAAHHLLRHRHDLPVRVVGVDSKQQSCDHNSAVARGLGLVAGPDLGSDAEFVVGTIRDAAVAQAPDVVLALHACDTATDEALARTVEWRAPVVLAAPCCHHDLAAQLRRAPTPAPYALLTRHGILRERLADTLTDGLRAALLRREGYRVDVMEFVASEHTPRNTLLRAVRTGAAPGDAAREYDEMVAAWSVHPRLADLLDAREGAW